MLSRIRFARDLTQCTICSSTAFLLFKGKLATHIGETAFDGNFEADDADGSDPGGKFISWLLQIADLMNLNYDKHRQVPKLTPEQREEHEFATECCICREVLQECDPDLDNEDQVDSRYTVPS